MEPLCLEGAQGISRSRQCQQCSRARAAIAVHSFGDFQQFNPHLHVIATGGCFSDTGTFSVAPMARATDRQELFRHEMFKMLKAEGKIGDAVIENMSSWRHSGFNVYCGHTIWPDNEDAVEDLARYICARFNSLQFAPEAHHPGRQPVQVVVEIKGGTVGVVGQ